MALVGELGQFHGGPLVLVLVLDRTGPMPDSQQLTVSSFR
jgi:hypothetical protein